MASVPPIEWTHHTLSAHPREGGNPDGRIPASPARLLRVRSDLHAQNLVRILDRLAALDLVDVLHPLDDLAPDRVLAVEERGVAEADEELAVARIGVGRARHRQRAALVRLLGEFCLQLLAR